MKRKNREINIFSMSALDLFASAMGAFLLIAVMALPYYLQVDKDLVRQARELKEEIKIKQNEIDEAKKEIEKEKEKLAKSEQEKEKLNKEQEEKNKKILKKLSKTFCVIKMNWNSNYDEDIDLYVIDPNEKKYYYKKTDYGDKGTSLTVDSGHPKKVKKGTEIWITNNLLQGTYIIKYTHPGGSNSTKVFGSIFTRDFTKDLPTVNIKKGEIKIISKIEVDSAGNATLIR